MSRYVLTLLMAILTFASAFAIDEDECPRFASSLTGLTLLVPPGTVCKQNDLEAIVLQTSDRRYLFIAEPISLESTSREQFSARLLEVYKRAELDPFNMDYIYSHTEFCEVKARSSDYENGGGAVAGVGYVIDTPIVFFITIIAGPDYVDYAALSINTFDYDPDVVDVEELQRYIDSDE